MASWSLPELAQHTGINAGHLSRIENGKRPPTEKVATEMDAVFPERKGWFLEYFSEMRGWSEVPASFRDWAELELGATRLHAWSPGVLHGLVQTEQYASALLATLPDVTEDVITARTVSRLDRQRRVLLRDERPETWFVVDEHSLYRLVGSPESMATQMRRLAEVAALPRVTMQVLPAVAHPAGASGFIVTDSAAYVEHVASGYVFTDEQTVSTLKRMFDTLRGECYRVSESLKMIERLGKAWLAEKLLLQRDRRRLRRGGSFRGCPRPGHHRPGRLHAQRERGGLDRVPGHPALVATGRKPAPGVTTAYLPSLTFTNATRRHPAGRAHPAQYAGMPVSARASLARPLICLGFAG